MFLLHSPLDRHSESYSKIRVTPSRVKEKPRSHSMCILSSKTPGTLTMSEFGTVIFRHGLPVEQKTNRQDKKNKHTGTKVFRKDGESIYWTGIGFIDYLLIQFLSRKFIRNNQVIV